MQIPGGQLADRFGAKPIISAAALAICFGNIMLGFAAAYWQLVLWKVFIGLGTGATFVAGARYTTTMFAGRRLHFAQGIYGASHLLGSGFVIFAVPIIFDAYGWQSVFLATATLAAAGLAIWLSAPHPAVTAKGPTSLAGMISDPQLWRLGFAHMASFGLVIGVGTWVTTYLTQSFGLSLKTAGQIGSLVLLLGIATRPLGGVVSRYGPRLTLLVSLGMNVAACVILATSRGSLWQAVLGVLILGVGCGLPYAPVFNRAAALYPGRAGTAMGLVNVFSGVAVLAAPPLIGQMVEWSGSFQSSFLALAAFAFAAFVTAFGIPDHESDRSV